MTHAQARGSKHEIGEHATTKKVQSLGDQGGMGM